MDRRQRWHLKIAVLGLGTVLGFASGFHGLRCARARQAGFERHVAQVCVDAARNAQAP